MKKVLFSVVMASSLMIASCGPSVCDCVNAKEEDQEEMKDDCEALFKKYEDKEEDLKKELESCEEK
jgi:protein involved in sex pheromone biosynthesis